MGRFMVKIGVFGATGRMGKEILQELGKSEKCSFFAGYERGKDLREFCSKFDVIIDFSLPEASLQLFAAAENEECLIVSGVTGFSNSQMEIIKKYAEKKAVFHANNMSFGVALLKMTVEKVAENLGEEFHVNILEKHHIHKIDSPSGTALMMGKAIADAQKNEFLPNFGEKPRQAGEIAFASLRSSDIIGEHHIIFESESEILEFTHKAKKRSLFALGAIKAAFWLFETKKHESGLFSIQNMLKS